MNVAFYTIIEFIYINITENYKRLKQKFYEYDH